MNNGFDAFVKLQLPPGLDVSGRTKYPMLIDVYAGPGSYNGADRWETGWNTYLSTNRKYIIAQINGRGSGNRGDKLLHTIYRKMGTVEVEDQIETAGYINITLVRSLKFYFCFSVLEFSSKLADLFPFIDEQNIAIWGWSYGGFTAGMALAMDDKKVFKCAASVAPVTDWTYYGK